MRTAGNAVDAYVKRHPQLLQERYFRALYFGAMLWIVLALFLGASASSALIRLVS
jgi:hypothetical protein